MKLNEQPKSNMQNGVVKKKKLDSWRRHAIILIFYILPVHQGREIHPLHLSYRALLLLTSEGSVHECADEHTRCCSHGTRQVLCFPSCHARSLKVSMALPCNTLHEMAFLNAIFVAGLSYVLIPSLYLPILCSSLGLFSDHPIALAGTPIDALCAHLAERLRYEVPFHGVLHRHLS